MTPRAVLARPAFWWTLAIVAGSILCYAAVDNGVYTATTPTTMSYYVVVRKLYSIIAFGLVGYIVARALIASGKRATIPVVGGIIAAYSTLIEVLQYYLDPPPEGLPSNAFDIACGFVGGMLAIVVCRALARLQARIDVARRA